MTVCRIRAGLQYAEQFAAGNDIEARAGFGQQLQNREIAVGLDGVANLVRNIAEGLVVGLEAVENRGARVDVAGRALAARDVGERNVFQVQRVIAIFHLAYLEHD